MSGLVVSRPDSGQSQSPVFRSRLDLIRTEVSVIATGTGEPVLGLEARDFSIFEDGKRQEIASFAVLDRSSPTFPESEAAAGSPKRRVFLIVFGAGYLPGPVMPFDGAIEFLRTRLRPHDLAAVMVWNRVTQLTTDHERLAQLVDRIRQMPNAVFVQTRRDIMRGLDVSLATQSALDDWMLPVDTPDGFLRSATAMLLGTAFYRERVDFGVPWERRLAGSDLLKVFAGIEYLRSIDGEKHLVLLSMYGLSPPLGLAMPEFVSHGADDDRRIAAQANDAGVALDIIHTIGTTVESNAFSSMSSAQLARESGGQFTSVRTAAQQLARLDSATRSGYVIGYMPTSPNLDGKYRTVDIRVNRKGVTVLHRRGYTARAQQPAVDPRAIMARVRLYQAADTTVRLDDIRIAASAKFIATRDLKQVRIEVAIDPARIEFTKTKERLTGKLDLMFVCADSRSNVTGSAVRQVDVDLSMEEFQNAVVHGIPYSIDIPVTGGAIRAKAIVYNYETDRLGVATIRIK